MELDDLKKAVADVEAQLPDAPFVVVCTYSRDGRSLHVCLTERLRKIARKAGLWNRGPFLSTLKNARYGFDWVRARSRGGSDGIFVVDRDFKPPNMMMRKIFDKFLDKNNSGVDRILNELRRRLGVRLQAQDLVPIRLVSHHMRLLGILFREESEDYLVLVDYDDTK